MATQRTVITGFSALNLEVDRETLSLRPHRWKSWCGWMGDRWRWVYACWECGVKYEPYIFRQTCLGVVGELMLAHERVPSRWTKNFPDRVRVSRRAWKPKKKKSKP